MRSEASRGPLFAHEEPEPLYSAGSEPAVCKVREIGTCFCVRALCVHGIVGYLRAARSLARRGRGRGSTADTRVRHHLSRSGTGKGDRLCRSEPINPSGSSASASLASWPAWPTAAAARCWPGDGVRDAMRSPSRKRTSSPRIARSLAVSRRPVWRARQMPVSRSRRVRRGTTTSAAAWRRRAHGAVAGEGYCRRSIGHSLSAERLRSTLQPLWGRRRSQERRRRATQPVEANHARGIAGIGPEAASRLRPGSHHPRHRRGASWVGRGVAAADADAASSRSA